MDWNECFEDMELNDFMEELEGAAWLEAEEEKMDIVKALATLNIYELENFLLENNINIRNIDGSFRNTFDVLKDCAKAI